MYTLIELESRSQPALSLSLVARVNPLQPRRNIDSRWLLTNTEPSSRVILGLVKMESAVAKRCIAFATSKRRSLANQKAE